MRKGEVLIVLDSAQQQAALRARHAAAVSAARQDIAASDADYDLANSTLTRYQTLFERKSVSPHEFDRCRPGRKAAAAHRDQAQAGIGAGHGRRSRRRVLAWATPAFARPSMA